MTGPSGTGGGGAQGQPADLRLRVASRTEVPLVFEKPAFFMWVTQTLVGKTMAARKIAEYIHGRPFKDRREDSRTFSFCSSRTMESNIPFWGLL
jgi:hypothetical protein